MHKIKYLSENFYLANTKLNAALQQPKNEFIYDSAIQRFELAFEYFWQTLKEYLVYKGIHAKYPASLKEAHKKKIISSDKKIIEMMKCKNMASQLFYEDIAEEIYNRLNEYSLIMKDTVDYIKLHTNKNGTANGKVNGNSRITEFKEDFLYSQKVK